MVVVQQREAGRSTSPASAASTTAARISSSLPCRCTGRRRTAASEAWLRARGRPWRLRPGGRCRLALVGSPRAGPTRRPGRRPGSPASTVSTVTFAPARAPSRARRRRERRVVEMRRDDHQLARERARCRRGRASARPPPPSGSLRRAGIGAIIPSSAAGPLARGPWAGAPRARAPGRCGDAREAWATSRRRPEPVRDARVVPRPGSSTPRTAPSRALRRASERGELRRPSRSSSPDGRYVRKLRFLGFGAGTSWAVGTRDATQAPRLSGGLELTRGEWDVFVGESLPGEGWPARSGASLSAAGQPGRTGPWSSWDGLPRDAQPRTCAQELRRKERRLPSGAAGFGSVADARELEPGSTRSSRSTARAGARRLAVVRRQEGFHRAFARRGLRPWLASAAAASSSTGVPVVAYLGFRFGAADWFYQLGRDPDAEAFARAAGRRAARSARPSRREPHEFRLGPGAQDYKLRFATGDRRARDGRGRAAACAGRARCRRQAPLQAAWRNTGEVGPRRRPVAGPESDRYTADRPPCVLMPRTTSTTPRASFRRDDPSGSSSARSERTTAGCRRLDEPCRVVLQSSRTTSATAMYASASACPGATPPSRRPRTVPTPRRAATDATVAGQCADGATSGSQPRRRRRSTTSAYVAWPPAFAIAAPRGVEQRDRARPRARRRPPRRPRSRSAAARTCPSPRAASSRATRARPPGTRRRGSGAARRRPRRRSP